MFHIEITDTQYNPWKSLEDFENKLETRAAIGACSVFTGNMRDFNEAHKVASMFLEHYPGMTEGYLQELLESCGNTFNLEAGLIIHRVGLIQPTETIVLIAAWSAHRRESFAACKQLIEDLKHQAPFWKKETLNDDSSRWVESNTPG